MPDDSLAIARRVLDIEAAAIKSMGERLDGSLDKAVEAILRCEGKVIVTGMGKSGHIARKIAATFASTGTPAVFVHPGEGMHGDLGVISGKDVVLAVSYSGSGAEIVGILPSVKRIGAPLIAMTGHAQSPLALAADIVVDVAVAEEACPLGLAPTASTTATLAMGDALAIVLLERRGFTEADFALFHPGGALGRRLLIRLKDLMRKESEVPRVTLGCRISNALLEMTSGRLGLTGVFDTQNRLVGCVSDGDLRRAMQKFENVYERLVEEIMTKAPKTLPADMLAIDALHVMESARISAVFITDEKDTEHVVGAVHLHDLLKAGF